MTLMMLFAEMQEIECSEDLPPNKTPTLIFSTKTFYSCSAVMG
jgi:hypothetical protein